MKPILKFYYEFLSDLSLKIGANGMVSDPAGNPVVVSIKKGVERKVQKLPLCLPTTEALEKDNGEVVYFHPACEGLDAGQSEVFNATLKLVTAMTHASVISAVNALLHVAADTSGHASLKQPVMEMVSQLPDVSQGTLASWVTLSKKLTINGEMALLSYHMERDQDIAGIKYGRVARFRTKLLESENLYTQKGMSQIAEKAIRKAFQLVVGTTSLDVGSNSPTAPYFTALAKCYHQVMQKVSRAAMILGVAEVNYRGEWSATIDNLHDWYRGDSSRTGTGLFIQLDGNIGDSVLRRQSAQATHPAQTASVASVQKTDNTMHIPQTAPMPQPVNQPPVQALQPLYQQPPQQNRTPGVMSIPAAIRPSMGQYQQGYGQMANNNMWFDDRTGQWRPRSTQPIQPPSQPMPMYPPQPMIGYQQPQQPAMGMTLIGYDLNGQPIYR